MNAANVEQQVNAANAEQQVNAANVEQQVNAANVEQQVNAANVEQQVNAADGRTDERTDGLLTYSLTNAYKVITLVMFARWRYFR